MRQQPGSCGRDGEELSAAGGSGRGRGIISSPPLFLFLNKYEHDVGAYRGVHLRFQRGGPSAGFSQHPPHKTRLHVLFQEQANQTVTTLAPNEENRPAGGAGRAS